MIELIEKRKSLNLRRKFLLKIMPAESRGMKESPIFTNTFNERIGAIDMARGIAIILMVIGHMGLKCTPYLYAFHMPLFFIISGMTISVDISKCKVQNFVYKKIRTLFIPYILWVLIYCPFNMFSLFLAIYGSRNAIESLQSFGPLWFLPCLMVSEILFFIILKICNCIRCGGGITASYTNSDDCFSNWIWLLYR